MAGLSPWPEGPVWGKQSVHLRCGLAEFWGTFVLILLGCGWVAQAELRGWTGGFLRARGPGAQVEQRVLAHMRLLGMDKPLRFVVSAGAYIGSGASGTHLNPAVSLAMCFLRRLDWNLLPTLCLAQLAGAFCGAATVFAWHYDALQAFSAGAWAVAGPNATAGIFASYPSGQQSSLSSFADQVMASAAFLTCVLAVLGEGAPAPRHKLQPPARRLALFLIGSALGSSCGCPINPAEDLGPRVFAAVAGWGLEVFRVGNHWWWIPVLGPLVGALLGASVYHHALALPALLSGRKKAAA
ncbi:aquaporin-9-like [Tachyglossus aculeatus]|uniref:aquaporin-9-like n=1 Tax=Tachyglossus aculeatus TaxID=9261 RepID=UPI0018F34D3E|nr:aquaporin-9-like [Tachyglossus aculeatus]